MKKNILIILALALFPILANAQLPKFGNVKIDEFNVVPETVTDTAANAMYLYHDTSSLFSFNLQGLLLLELEYKARIKVLKEDGKDCANVVINYRYDPSLSSVRNDAIYGISAASYNLVNGKVEKTNMPDKYVFTEQVSDGYRQVKFSIPNVKVGTIIEYKFKRRSPLYWFVPTWYAQKNYPVKYAQFRIDVPEFFTFNHFCKGYTNVDMKKEDVNVNFYQSSDAEPVHGYKIEAKAQNVPAIKNEGFVENTDIYATRIEFELISTQVPGVSYKSYALNWSDVRKMMKDDVFNQYLGMKNPFAEEMAGMDLNSKNKIDRAVAVFSLLKSKVKWNQTYELVAKRNPKSAINDGKGSNAELNFVLMSMLKDAGVTCTPMLIKKRMHGPILTPTSDDFSTFIVAFVNDDNSLYFLDSSADYGYVNAIPVNLLGYGVLYELGIVEDPLPVYNLYDLGGYTSVIEYQAIINTENGELQGSKKETCTGINSMLFKERYHETDSIEFIKNIEKKDDIKLISYVLRNGEGIGPSCRQSYRFTKSLDMADNRIYVNPMVLPDEHSNPFTRETRLYPVEFPFQQQTKVTARIIIPEGYEVEELPESKTISMPDGSIGATISVEVQNGMIITKYASDLATTLVAPESYAALRKLWTDLLEMNNLTVVLKKK